MEEQQFTPQEQQIIEEVSRKIDLSNAGMILQYGSGAQKKIADFSDSILEKVQTRELGEVGDLLLSVTREVDSVSAEPPKKGLFGFLRRGKPKARNIQLRYETAQRNIQDLCDALERNMRALLKDADLLERMYQMNLDYLRDLSLYIAAGRRKVEMVRAQELPALNRQAEESGRPEDRQEAERRLGQCDRFEKKLHDLELTRMVAMQMCPQIRMVQDNDVALSEKIQSVLSNTIPLWKSQMVLALGIAKSQSALQAHRQVTEATSELLRENARALRTATVETARETQRGVVNLEVLQETNASLLDTLEETIRIQNQGREKRQEAEQELGRLEQEIKQRLVTV